MVKADITPVAGRVMTDIALLGGLDMRRMHAGGLAAVVAGGATAGGINPTMVKTGIQPVIGGEVTDIALFTGLNMLCMFTGRPGAVVAGGTDTGALKSVMAEVDDMPVCGGRMTDVAGFIGDDMSIVFAWRLYPIMTACTGTRHNFTVIEAHHTPILCRGMAGIALSRGLYMIRILTGLCDAVMTTGATAEHLFPMDKVNH